jgi:hypothetical protein
MIRELHNVHDRVQSFRCVFVESFSRHHLFSSCVAAISSFGQDHDFLGSGNPKPFRSLSPGSGRKRPARITKRLRLPKGG